MELFECHGCGACCRIPDGIVRVSEDEISRIAAFLGMTEDEFVANETDIAPDRKGLILKSRADDSCVWLARKAGQMQDFSVRMDKPRFA